MSKTIYNGSVKTQSIDSVKSLLAYVGRGCDPLPTDVSLEGGRVVLILSNKKDAYYCTTAHACSCPANTWHPGTPCKHQRKHFPQVATAAATKPATSEPLVKRGGFRSFDTTPGEERARATPSFCIVDTLPDATPRELAYWSIQEDKIMWPCEA